MKCILLAGADPGFQVRWGALKKSAPSGGWREHVWCISCEKSRSDDKKSYFFPILGGGRGTPPHGSALDLQYLQTNDDGKSGVHLSAILRFDFFASSGLQSLLHTVVPITVTLQSSASWDLIDACEWISTLGFDILRLREMKSISLQHFIWWSYRFSGAMLCCLVQAADNR